MINAILKGLLTFMGNVIGVFTTPIDLIISNAFPDFSSLISNFNDMVSYLVAICSRAFGNIFGILPNGTKNAIIFYVGTLVIVYTTSLAIHGVIKVIEIIKAIKIW